jgi:hypothetical protein
MADMVHTRGKRVAVCAAVSGIVVVVIAGLRLLTGPAVRPGFESSSGKPEQDTPVRITEPVGRGESGAVLEGRVLDPSGAARAGAQVRIFRTLDPRQRATFEELLDAGADIALEFFCTALGETLSGRDGSYRFSGLQCGAYTIRVTASGFGYHEQDVLLGPYEEDW